MKPTPLSTAFLRLKNADPEGYDRAVGEFAQYVSLAFGELARCGPDAILGVQGQVRMGQAVLRIMQECHIPPETAPTPQQ